MRGFDEVIKLVYIDGRVLGPVLGNVYGIILEIYFGTNMSSLDGYFDGSNYSNIEGLLL